MVGLLKYWEGKKKQGFMVKETTMQDIMGGMGL